MKISVSKVLLASVQPEAKIEHSGEELIFLAGSFFRMNSVNPEFDIFEHLNEYWNQLPVDKQDYIFGIYKRIRMVFNSVSHRVNLALDLNKLCIELIDAHNLDEVYDWVLFKSNIVIPAVFESEYQYSYDKQGSRDQTYVRSDYTKLIAMIIAIRSMIPVWGEYIGQTKHEAGTTFKEMGAFQLITNSSIMTSQPMLKLSVYLDHAVGQYKFNPFFILDGISSMDFPIWMMSIVVIRRLCVGDIRGVDSKANMITYIYKFVIQRIQSTDSGSSSAVKDKKTTEFSDEKGDDKISTFERYRIKHDISTGEIVELAYSIKDIRSTAYRLSPNMTDDILFKSIETAQELNNRDIHEPQTILLKWVFKPVISPRGLMYLDKDLIVNCLGILEAVLFVNGFHYLALLATSYPDINTEEMYVSSTESKARITKAQIARLDELYPFQQVIGGKKSGYKDINPSIKAIDSLTDKLSMFSWITTASDDKLETALNSRNTRRIGVTYDIKIQLADLVIKIGSRTL